MEENSTQPSDMWEVGKQVSFVDLAGQFIVYQVLAFDIHNHPIIQKVSPLLGHGAFTVYDSKHYKPYTPPPPPNVIKYVWVWKHIPSHDGLLTLSGGTCSTARVLETTSRLSIWVECIELTLTPDGKFVSAKSIK